MIRIVLPADVSSRKLPFYLALEEWIAKTLPNDEYFFTWTVPPTVIFGRNQDIEAEVNMEYCRENGIEFYRRKSGGGCVYADTDNIMVSYIAPGTDVKHAFRRFNGMIVHMLSELDIKAEASERNDVLIDGRKVSGCAFYRLTKHSIVHSTLLFSTNLDHMANAITPCKTKLERHRVQSVPQRITTIKEHEPYMKLETFVNFINFVLSDEDLILSPEAVRQVEKIEKGYYNPDFIYGKKKGQHSTNLPNVGNFAVDVTLDHGKIDQVNVTGDYFPIYAGTCDVLQRLHGIEPTHDAIISALEGINVGDFVLNLINEDFAKIILDSIPQP